EPEVLLGLELHRLRLRGDALAHGVAGRLDVAGALALQLLDLVVGDQRLRVAGVHQEDLLELRARLVVLALLAQRRGIVERRLDQHLLLLLDELLRARRLLLGGGGGGGGARGGLRGRRARAGGCGRLLLGVGLVAVRRARGERRDQERRERGRNEALRAGGTQHFRSSPDVSN